MQTSKSTTTALRAVRNSQISACGAIRPLSSEAGPSSPPTPTPTSSRRLPRPVLRNLVELHHHSSTFLQDPSTITSGFQTAFNTIHIPTLTKYEDFSRRALALHARRSLGGLDNLLPKVAGGTGAFIPNGPATPTPARVSRSAWTGRDSWGELRDGGLTERETRVNEALYGTWQRGLTPRNTLEADVGLEGVEEYAEAKGKDVAEEAKAWAGRHEEA